MSEKQNTSISNDELVKALQTLGISTEEETDIQKSEGGDDNSDDSQKNDNTDEKPEEVLKSEVETLRSQLEAKEAELAALEVKGDEGKTIEKSEEETIEGKQDESTEEDNEFQKSIADQLGAISTILKSGEESKQSLIESMELMKSENDELKGKVNEMEELVKAIAQSSPGLKSLTNTQNISWLEKSNEDNLNGGSEDGKQVLSKSKQKSAVENVLEKGFDSTTDDSLKSEYGNSIFRFNGGGGSISKSVENDLLNNHNVRLVQ